ncbi:MAG TPA: flavin reductase family protein [Alphaproteobacteria bacterium]|nr:flavin reductase family protein [Alphaproteobacteria bacterium]
MPDFRSFRQWFGGFATGVTVVTVKGAGGAPAGITINSLTSVSLEPPLLLFCLDRTAHVYPLFKKTPHFAVNILSEDQDYLARHFADYRHHAAPKNIWARGDKTGCPALRHTLGWMVCRRTAIHKAGDHAIFVGQAVDWHKTAGQLKPLLYFHSRYRRIGR